MNNRKIEILDCTLRDGGLALEDAFINGLSDLSFSKENIRKLIELFNSSIIDIIELGSIEISEKDKSRFSVYQNIESISKLKHYISNDTQKLAALFRGPDTPINQIPEWNESLCEYTRVIIRYSELEKSLEFCKSLSKKGYKVCIQPMVTMRYSELELQLLVDYANNINAYALYIVDSYGYMQAEDLQKLFIYFDTKLHSNIAIGFHGHNNMNLGFSNVLALLSFKSNRNLIIDATILGMGQGAGNVQTEIMTYYMNNLYSTLYNNTAILDAVEILEKFISPNLWGYSVTTLLPAHYKTAYKYAVTLRNKFGLSYSEIDAILANMPEEYRQRYTLENVRKILNKKDIK